MEKKGRIYILLLCILGLFESHRVLAEKSEACFGTGENVDMFWLSLQCPSSNMITITKMYYGVKQVNTSCSPPVNNASLTHCCQYDKSSDCLVDVFDTETSEKVLEIFSNCTGYDDCYEQATWNRATGCDDSGIYFTYSNYMMAQYQCIPDSQIIQPDSAIETSVTEIHIQSVGYPNGTYNNSQMACSIEVPCDSSLELTAIDLQLGSSTGTFDSTYNNLYERRELNLTGSKRFLVIDIDFADNSKFWIHVKANDSSNLDIACGNKKHSVPLDDCLPTTTEEPTTTQQLTATEDQTTIEQLTTTEQLKTTEDPTTTKEPTATEQTTREAPTTTEEPTTTNMLLNSSSITPSNLPQVDPIDNGQDDVGMIAGIVCSVIIAIIICITIAVYLAKKKKNNVSPSSAPSSTYNKASESQNPLSETTSNGNNVLPRPPRATSLRSLPKPWNAGLQTPEIIHRSGELAPLKESRYKPDNSNRNMKLLTDIESPDIGNVHVNKTNPTSSE